MMAIEGKQTSDANPLPYNLLQHDPAKGLAGLAEGLEPTSATDEELDDYEQVLFDETQDYMLGRSMLTHQCQAPALLRACACACNCSMYMSYLTMPQTCRLQAHRVTKCRESAPGASKGILGDALCLPVRLPQMQLEFGNVDFLDTHQLRQRLSDNASRVRTRVQQVHMLPSC